MHVYKDCIYTHPFIWWFFAVLNTFVHFCRKDRLEQEAKSGAEKFEEVDNHFVIGDLWLKRDCMFNLSGNEGIMK